ncbi:LytTR family DNA-binding domain-containing protein [Sphingomonas sp.]|uniref:LytTR family DNA-binding domain-containing protein n=1 Tax=Sphingomonas sp. TaxID=28214 RepID=UPI001B0BA933|nr:LytTR family DNA-binding domain-containing protein [Sphingomonas sp.]MBO9715039.1 LytTR family transcriptional regulator DNA-binding domain-containing protein [Sphingomonas sp.]
MFESRRLVIDVAISLGIGVLAALLGPLGSFQAPFAIRLLYWLPLALAGYFLYRPAVVLAIRAAERLDLPEAGAWAAACALATVPMTIVVWLINFLPKPPPWPTASQAIGAYGNVLLLGGIVSAVFWILQRRAEPLAEATTPEPAPTPTSPFLDRLPPHLGTALIALEMEDHYVRAYTDLGSALVLMRMRDAAAELAGIEGMQVHRSWWVARAAVTGSRRDGRNLRLTLAAGLEAPVARDKVAELQAAGWL